MANDFTSDPQNQKQPVLTHAQNIPISEETQRILNEPIKHPQGLNDKDQIFLAQLMEKIDKGDINLYRPSTLLNLSVYEQLNEEAKGKADFDAVNLLNSIREIRKLWLNGQHDTYQIENMVHRIRITKERLEELGGDIFII